MIDNFWKNRKNERMEEYYTDHAHRQMILDVLEKLNFNSVLEIGCGCGYNLKLIKEKFNVHVAGIDINEHAVNFGRSKGLDLIIGNATELDYLPTDSFDLIMTDALLVYVEPKDIKRVILNFVRISRKALVFCEFYDQSKLGRQCFDNWGRNYPKLLLDFGLKCKKIKITKEVWSEPSWSTIGYIFITEIA